MSDSELKNQEELKRIIRLWLGIFIFLLILSGATAFPLAWETNLLRQWTEGPFMQQAAPDLASWIKRVHQGIHASYNEYPFLAYATDWLAFAHIVIGIAFIGPLRDPIRNIWVIEFGMIACLLVLPFALVCGPIRGIPFFWQLIDCSFGVFGLIPLSISYFYTRKLGRFDE